ncbi:uncharacterized protein LOC130361063 [Hyla sarda]|uniref:uncharacterized protein LOC130361063 n=1 Tax=Hyla sarda TaxID=327740 RepID=UPI0024C2C284|nr:uncharacterized protein LOC130361063 [Hyla sarda]
MMRSLQRQKSQRYIFVIKDKAFYFYGIQKMFVFAAPNLFYSQKNIDLWNTMKEIIYDILPRPVGHSGPQHHSGPKRYTSTQVEDPSWGPMQDTEGHHESSGGTLWRRIGLLEGEHPLLYPHQSTPSRCSTSAITLKGKAPYSAKATVHSKLNKMSEPSSPYQTGDSAASSPAARSSPASTCSQHQQSWCSCVCTGAIAHRTTPGTSARGSLHLASLREGNCRAVEGLYQVFESHSPSAEIEQCPTQGLLSIAKDRGVNHRHRVSCLLLHPRLNQLISASAYGREGSGKDRLHDAYESVRV